MTEMTDIPKDRMLLLKMMSLRMVSIKKIHKWMVIKSQGKLASFLLNLKFWDPLLKVNIWLCSLSITFLGVPDVGDNMLAK